MYKDAWESCIGEELVCKQERHNVHDLFADNVVAIYPDYFQQLAMYFLGDQD